LYTLSYQPPRLYHSDEFDPLKSWKRKQKLRKTSGEPDDSGEGPPSRQEKKGVKRKRAAVPGMDFELELDDDGWARVNWEGV
jgi:hypothetical protein